MSRRPLSITLIGWLFVATGCFGLFGAARAAFAPGDPDPRELVPMALSGLLAMSGGLFALAGRNWARWILYFWMTAHIALSVAHSLEQLLVHVALFAPIVYFLVRRPAREFFRGAPPVT